MENVLNKIKKIIQQKYAGKPWFDEAIKAKTLEEISSWLPLIVLLLLLDDIVEEITKMEKIKKEESMELKQRPTIGRIVWYFFDNPHEGKTMKAWPAVITHVWSEDCVNLYVFRDGTFGAPDMDPPISVLRGRGPRQWDWPPIIAVDL